MTADIDIRLTAGAAIAREAGLLARQLFNDGVTATFKAPQDYVTEADAKVEALIRSRLSALFPGDAIVGEEMGGVAAKRTWIVDPIDGTANFAHRHPNFAVSIACVDEHRPMIGVVYMPMTDALYTACCGAGAQRNGQRIAASACGEPSRAYVELGYSPRSTITDHSHVQSSLLRAGMLVRWSGSAVISLVQVAEGSSDAYFDLHLNPWDVAAGLVIVQEAGGYTSDFFAGDGILAGNPLLASGARFSPVMHDIVAAALANSPLLAPCHGLRRPAQ